MRGNSPWRQTAVGSGIMAGVICMNQEDFLADFIEYMIGQGLSVTTQRKAIAEAFFSFPGHHTSEEFYNHISAIAPHIGQTTVYRTLKLLCAAGLATEIQFSDNIARYEVADPRQHHDHLICLACGKVVEVYDSRIEAIQSDLAEQHGFALKGHSHNLYGVCHDCRRKTAETRDAEAMA